MCCLLWPVVELQSLKIIHRGTRGCPSEQACMACESAGYLGVVFAFKGPADLTFDDHNCLFVPADRVLVTMTEDGAGALRISPGHLPPMTEIVTALATGPFVLTFDGGML